MKTTTLAALAAGTVLIGSLAAFAQEGVRPMLKEGTRAGHIAGRMDSVGNDFGMQLGGSAGYFIMDYVEVGLFANFGFRGSDTKWVGAGVYGEHHFDMDWLVVPYAGGRLGLGWRDDFAGDDFFLELTAYGGARYFFVDHAAVGADLALSAATAKMYNARKDAFDWALRIGTSWYF